MKLGIFDSGIGGEAVANSLRTAFPDADYVLADDRPHLPYGDRTPEDITNLTDVAIQPLLQAECDVIIIACNSATSAALETLRERYPSQAFIGLEPMIKPASELTKTGVIAVCATPATLGSQRYKKLKDTHAASITVLEPDCSSWAYMIEENDLNEDTIEETILSVINQGADIIVLACTHYHWIHEAIEEVAAGRAEILSPSDAIARRVSSILNKE